MCTGHFTVYNLVQTAECTIFLMNSVQFDAQCIVQCTVYNTVHNVLYSVQNSVQYSAQCIVQCTEHCTPQLLFYFLVAKGNKVAF